MITLFASVCIEAPATTVWAQLATLEDIQLWSAAVVRARCDGAVTRGVGAERTCDRSRARPSTSGGSRGMKAARLPTREAGFRSCNRPATAGR